MGKIIYSGLNALNEGEQLIVKKVLEKEYPKIEKLIGQSSELMVHIKTSVKEKRKRYILSLRLEGPKLLLVTKTKDTEAAGDWDLTKATHKAMEHIASEVRHKLKIGEETWKKGGIKKLLDNLKFS